MRVDKNYIIPCNATFFRSLIARIFFYFFFIFYFLFFIGGTSSIIARSPMRHGTHKTFVSVTDRKPNIIISRVFMSRDSHMCFEFSCATCTPFRALFVKGFCPAFTATVAAFRPTSHCTSPWALGITCMLAR